MKKRYIFLGIFVLLLVAARLALPPIAQRELNAKLANLDGPFCGHVDHLGLSLIRGSYIFDGFSLSRRSPDRSRCDDPVLSMKRMRAAVSWRALFHRKLRLNLFVRSPVVFVDSLEAALKTNSKQENEHGAKQAADTVLPWRIDGIRLTEGSIHMKLLGTGDSAVTLEHAEGVIAGISEGERESAHPVYFRLRGDVFKSAKLLITGKVDLSAAPTMWKVSYATEKLHLPNTNRLLLNRVPMTFVRGNLDLYGEAAGGGKKLTGYTKLIFDHVQVLGGKKKWHSAKQGLVEVVSSLFFAISKNPDAQTAGLIVNFGMKDGKFAVDTAGALRTALAHGTGSRVVHPGIENRLTLPSRENAVARQGGENL